MEGWRECGCECRWGVVVVVGDVARELDESSMSTSSSEFVCVGGACCRGV